MKALLAVSLLGLLALAGCAASGPQTPAMDDEGRYVIHMTSGNRFSPMVAQVPVGATVIWVNSGGIHDVTATDGSWSSDAEYPERMEKGDTFQRTFDAAGTVDYRCVLHAPNMKGTLIVQ